MSGVQVNGEAAISRKEKALALLDKIRAELHRSYESFYHVGMMLRDLEWDVLGYRTFKECLREELQMSYRHARQLITAAELRPKLPECSIEHSGEKVTWSESTVRQLLRLETQRDQVRVARKVVQYVEKNPGEKFTAKLVKTFVDQEKAPKPLKEKPVKQGEGNLHVILMRYVYQMEEWCGTLNKNVPKEGWILLRDKQPEVVERFIAVCESLASFVREVKTNEKRS